MPRLFSALALALGLSLAGGADAATVKSGATLVGGGGGIEATSGTVVGVTSPFYSTETTTPHSEWVWIDNIFTVHDAIFEFRFDLTGYDISTASLFGLWGVDNFGVAELNGHEIGLLPDFIADNFTALNAYGTRSSAPFVQGENVLRFILNSPSGQAGFRATAQVNATLSAIPLPAGAPLLVGGIALLAGLRRYRRG